MLAADLAPVLVLPGLGDSGPQHWQSMWLTGRPGFRRVEQADWDTPRCDDWVAVLDRAVLEAGSDTVLVAHSLACALVAHWAARSPRPVRGALLVSPSDTEAPSFPAEPRGFSPTPLQPLPFASTVVASSDDPYVALDRARHFAARWGSRFVNVGPAGHINSASGLGDWPAGLELLVELAARARSANRRAGHATGEGAGGAGRPPGALASPTRSARGVTSPLDPGSALPRSPGPRIHGAAGEESPSPGLARFGHGWCNGPARMTIAYRGPRRCFTA